MRCRAVITIDHSNCPAGTPCIADPCAVMPGHLAMFIECENRAVPGEKFCKKHMKKLGIPKREDR